MSSIKRRPSRKVLAGAVGIGGDSPITVQSMTCVPTSDVEAVLEQIRILSLRGAEIVRVAVPDRASAEVLGDIAGSSPVPVAADVHFDPDIAMMALKAGVQKLRLNPGNIRDRKALRKIAEEAGRRSVPIRIGVNSGSIPGDIRESCGGVTSKAMWMAARRHADMLEETGFRDIVLSLKASDPLLTIRANRLAASESDYPLHLGVTEAGPGMTGAVRSATALSILLWEGIGDTLRISLSGSPEMEPVAGWEILSSLGIRSMFPRIVSCPTCARARLDVEELARSVQDHLTGIRGSLTVAVMGCEVNGPGEAREADIAVIGTPSGLKLFVDGDCAGDIKRGKLGSLLRKVVDSYIRSTDETSGGICSGSEKDDQDSAG